MSIRLYDSKVQALVDFTPREAGKVGMYVCGPTVQSSPHIGHLRSALAYDLWRRWFTYRGLDVTFVRNVTDIDDKVLHNSSEREHALRRTRRMHAGQVMGAEGARGVAGEVIDGEHEVGHVISVNAPGSLGR